MYTVAIVDDDINDLNKLKDCFSFVEEETEERFRIDGYDSAASFFMHYENQYNIVMLDIEMPDINGIETAKKIRENDKSVVIIFVTNSAKYAMSGYEVDALDYILKPVDRYAFMLKMHRILSRVETRKDFNLLLKTDEGTECLQISHIKYVEVFGHYVVYHTYYGDYSVYSTLSAEAEKLPPKQFVKCSRNCIVNLRYVESVRNNVCIVSGEELIVSRPQKKNFMQALQDYMR